MEIVSEEDKTEEECRGLVPTLSLQPGPLLGLDMLINEELPAKDLTVWIDPLDATQEFTGIIIFYYTFFMFVKLLTECFTKGSFHRQLPSIKINKVITYYKNEVLLCVLTVYIMKNINH